MLFLRATLANRKTESNLEAAYTLPSLTNLSSPFQSSFDNETPPPSNKVKEQPWKLKKQGKRSIIRSYSKRTNCRCLILGESFSTTWIIFPKTKPKKSKFKKFCINKNSKKRVIHRINEHIFYIIQTLISDSTKCSNTFKQCLCVFDHFAESGLKDLRNNQNPPIRNLSVQNRWSIGVNSL